MSSPNEESVDCMCPADRPPWRACPVHGQMQRYIDDAAAAIRRVGELHRPVEYTVPGVRVVTVCMECRHPSAHSAYPCPTIQALNGAS